VIIAGRITRDSEVRHTTNTGAAICSFDVAMSRRIRDAATGEWKDADPVFVPITVWGEQAERCGDRVKKGAPVYIEGRLQTSKWEDKVTKQMRSKLEVVAQRVQFLTRAAGSGVAFQAQADTAAIGAKVDSEQEYQQEQEAAPIGSKAKEQSLQDDEDDIPF
jgi:single-strand DNA-binding protein